MFTIKRPAAPLAAAALGLVAALSIGSAAMARVAVGTVSSVDIHSGSVTLTDGRSFGVGTGDGLYQIEGLRPGNQVAVTYVQHGDQVATLLIQQTTQGRPPAIPVQEGIVVGEK